MLRRRAAAERDRRLMLDEQHGVGDAPGFACLLQLVLQSMHGFIGRAPQPKRAQLSLARHSGILAPESTSSLRRPSICSVKMLATSGSNCEPEQRKISLTVTSCGSARRYARSLVMAS